MGTTEYRSHGAFARRCFAVLTAAAAVVVAGPAMSKAAEHSTSTVRQTPVVVRPANHAPVSGGLALSIDAVPKAMLPRLDLNPTAELLETSGDIRLVTVTDERNDTPGFTVTATMTDFQAVDAAGGVINAADVGWTPFVDNASSGMQVRLGSAVPPAPGIAAHTSPADPGVGLSAPRILAASAPGVRGTVQLGAHLRVTAPTSTPVGTYVATLTITVI